jgi:tRNA 2-thiouridine synthesizing protein A
MMALFDSKHDFFLDVSNELCPMTFVRIKVLLDTMGSGQVAKIILSSGEALNNVPIALREHGFTIRGLAPLEPANADSKYQVIVSRP